MSVVLDASAVLALVNSEPGANVVGAVASEAAMSAVNLSEVVAKLVEGGMPEEAIRQVLEELNIEVTPFDSEQAYRAGLLRLLTRPIGLSLGGRACIALGIHLGREVLTADRSWAGLDLGIEVRLIR